jgi:acyl-CoA synthetase (NDP forming)
MTPGPLPTILREGAASEPRGEVGTAPAGASLATGGNSATAASASPELAAGPVVDGASATAPFSRVASTPSRPTGDAPWSHPASPARAAAVKVPTFRAPEAAARALGRAAAYGRFRATPPATPARLDDVDADAAAAVLAGSLARGGGWLRPDEVATLLEAYGIRLVEQRRVGSVAAAAKAAAELGGPVALKGVAPGVAHKAQAGAVRLGLNGPTAVRRAAQEITARMEASGTPVEDFLVQRMVSAGVEMLVGVLADERFGPVVVGPDGAPVVDARVRVAPPAVQPVFPAVGR